jgi:hypothetical protein
MSGYAVYKNREAFRKRNMNIASEMSPECSVMLGSPLPMGYKWLVDDNLEVVGMWSLIWMEGRVEWTPDAGAQVNHLQRRV